MQGTRPKIPVLYLAPWIIYGGTDKNTIDWFRWLDHDRFAPYLVTTQPSANQRLAEAVPYAEEVWDLPDLMAAERMPEFILDFISSRQIEVLHVMNSRLGFDLLPDLAGLQTPPEVVVQLHVEEEDRSGYVRYVTTRYGNLVDRFSVSHHALADAVHEYGIPREKIDVIYIGVDAADEFAPERVEPIEQLDDERLHLLFPARLVEQKDPLLMVAVAALLRDRGVRFQIHVLGEGELEAATRERIVELRLGDEILLHPPTDEPQRWYAACDAALMTSRFEGVPAVVFEAMGIGMPIVAPALPGNVELLGADYPGLVAERGDAVAYADAVERLARDREGALSEGAELRQRALDEFSLQKMADDHGRIYEELAAGREPAPTPTAPPPLPAPLRFRDRAAAGPPPLVSIVIPHYNQSTVLVECLDSIADQTHPAVEVVVVDDASTEAGAAAVLDAVERREGVSVLRLEENGGPSRARNRGIERCKGRYVLPVDADNMLLPEAVADLVAQLRVAAEDIGFVYPNLDYFGNRNEYHEAPAYDLYALLFGNFCDTCSLIDAEVFDAGLRYSEDIHLGHEDWEFVLQLAARGVRGEPAHGHTVRYRKWGFNRSDMVDHASDDFRDDFLAEASPFVGREAEVKAAESPGLSLLPLAPLDDDAAERLAAALDGQVAGDCELVARWCGSWPGAAAPPVRLLDPDLAESAGDAVRDALEASRGVYAAISVGDCNDLLADPAFVAKVLWRFETMSEDLDAIVLVDAGATGRFDFRGLDAGEAADAAPHTVIWRRSAELVLPDGMFVDAGDAVGSVARLLSGGGLSVEWRHFAAAASTGGNGAAPGAPPGEKKRIAPDPRAVEDPYGLRPGARALLPGAGTWEARRWSLTPSWVPPHSTVLIRYRERYGDRRLCTNGIAPPGYDPEYHLGALRSSGFPGTAPLVAGGGSFHALRPGHDASDLGETTELGHVELARLPEMDVLQVGVHRATGQHLIVASPGDPLLSEVDVISELGCADAFPLRPREAPSHERPLGLLGLTKAVDGEAGRFRYALGARPAAGETVEEIGALGSAPEMGAIPVWILDDYLHTSSYAPPVAQRPGGRAALRWMAEPMRWAGMAGPAARAKTAGRRAAISAGRRLRGAGAQPLADGEPDGWLFADYRHGRVPLFSSHHPVTGDQCLTRSREDPAHLGYVDTQLLGYLRLAAPVTGDWKLRHGPVPFARRFGHVPQLG